MNYGYINVISNIITVIIALLVFIVVTTILLTSWKRSWVKIRRYNKLQKLGVSKLYEEFIYPNVIVSGLWLLNIVYLYYCIVLWSTITEDFKTYAVFTAVGCVLLGAIVTFGKRVNVEDVRKGNE